MAAYRIALFGVLCGMSVMVSHAALCPADSQTADEPANPKPKVIGQAGAGTSLQSIHEDYARQLLLLERQRLDRLGQLAARQAPTEAAKTYEQLFRLAIANNLFTDAEAAANEALKPPNAAPPVVQFLAHTIDLIASVDRGDFDSSTAKLRSLIEVTSRRQSREVPGPALDTSALLAICQAYHGRLIQGNRFDVARNACNLVLKASDNPAVREFCTRRIGQLDLIGNPAPAIEGTDLDGKPFSLAKLKGNVVLVVFWASWCVPSSAEVSALTQTYDAYRDRGFRIVGINLDPQQNDGPKLDTVMPNIRRFVLDHNIPWPNLVNGTGAHDYASAYRVSEIPANILVGRTGDVVTLDLGAKNLDSVISQQSAK
jgi:thiol-disulfide isomerase/thioredoxin